MRFGLDILRRSRSFWIVIALFAIGNAWTWLRHRFDPQCCDIEMTIGFPVPFHIGGGMAGASDFYVLGLLLDITIATTLALIVTWIVSAVRGHAIRGSDQRN